MKEKESATVNRALLPFESRVCRVREHGDLHYFESGGARRPIILFVHGTPGWSFEFRNVIRLLGDEYRCIAFDHLGFGLSDAPADADYSLQAHGFRFSEFVEELNLGRFHLVIHDFGGIIALPWVMRHLNRVRALTVINSWFWSLRHHPQFHWPLRLVPHSLWKSLYVNKLFAVNIMMKRSFHDSSPLTDEVFRHYLMPFEKNESRLSTLAMLDALRDDDPLFEETGNLRGLLEGLPAQVIWGEKDRFLPGKLLLPVWRQIFPGLPFHSLRAGHYPHEEKPEDVARFIRMMEEQL